MAPWTCHSSRHEGTSGTKSPVLAMGKPSGRLGPLDRHDIGRGQRTFASLCGNKLKLTASLALLLGAVQFSLTLWGYAVPAPRDWAPLLAMALVVGVFESVCFRGFIQGRLVETKSRRSGREARAIMGRSGGGRGDGRSWRPRPAT